MPAGCCSTSIGLTCHFQESTFGQPTTATRQRTNPEPSLRRPWPFLYLPPVKFRRIGVTGTTRVNNDAHTRGIRSQFHRSSKGNELRWRHDGITPCAGAFVSQSLWCKSPMMRARCALHFWCPLPLSQSCWYARRMGSHHRRPIPIGRLGPASSSARVAWLLSTSLAFHCKTRSRRIIRAHTDREVA